MLFVLVAKWAEIDLPLVAKPKGSAIISWLQTYIFVAAQRGDIATLRALLDSGRALATDRDPQNITPLHWAAINAQLPACCLLHDDSDSLIGDTECRNLGGIPAERLGNSAKH